ncbi:MAG: PDZ domain-containing protein [Dactylosporangium sp.]|nr:trypsin-like peptidase domain-containing protein [Dactylosporangium sp.]NNJ62621.1 PDZ domain-containing protein [Dactylosporangium sp.]
MWWSDALSDPWRDPRAPAVVVATPSTAGPELEPATSLRQPDRPRAAGLGMLLTIAVVTALIAGGLGGTLGYVFAVRGGTIGGTQLGDGQAAPLAQRPPETIAGLVKKVLPSVITLRVESGDGTSLGSGLIVSADGFAVTNNHVVEGSSGSIVITFSDASTASAKIVGSDPESDIAVVKIAKDGLPPVEFGDSDALQVGDPVIAIGSPLALSNTVTYGIVSALDRPIRTDDEAGGVRYYAAIQTDAAVNQGNSGGPLFDAAGRVVGVNSVIGSLAEDQEHAGNVGLAFAIPVNQAKRVAQDIINTGKAKRTVIGAQLDSSYHSGGAKLTSVASNGPAAAAGLRSGDTITKIGNGVVEEPWDLIALVRKYPPGATVSVEYTRDGGRQTLSVTLAADTK